MKNLFNFGLILALILCVADALGQSHPQHANQTKLAEEHSLLAASTSTSAHGEADTFEAPIVLNIDHSDLGSLARQLRAAHNPKARVRWSQDAKGRMVSEAETVRCIASVEGSCTKWLVQRQ